MMYLLVQADCPELLVDIQVVENFSSRNCMNCVSGYYVNVMRAAFEMIARADV